MIQIPEEVLQRAVDAANSPDGYDHYNPGSGRISAAAQVIAEWMLGEMQQTQEYKLGSAVIAKAGTAAHNPTHEWVGGGFSSGCTICAAKLLHSEAK